MILSHGSNYPENDLAVGKFLIEERPYPHLLLHRSAGPALPQPVDNLLRNAPCQCTAHATARADIGFSNQNAFLAPGHFLSTIRNFNKK